MRRPNGAGSVYKLSGNRRNPFAAMITTGYDESGKVRKKALGYFATRKEALAALDNYNVNPYNVTNSNMTINQLYDIFLTKKKQMSKSAQGVYRAAIRNLSPIGDMPIREVRTYHIQNVIDNLDKSWQTKDHVKSLINQLYDIALELDIVQKKYSDFVNIGEKTASNIHKPFTKEEIAYLFTIEKTDKFAQIPLILCYTGLRPSELLNIKKENIFIKERYMIGGSKTEAGKNRIIPIHKNILPFIAERYLVAKNHLIEYNGKPINLNNIKEIWKKFMLKYNMEHLPHDGRHTFATMAEENNVGKLTIKRIMGHADDNITDKVYTHTGIEYLIKCIDKIV